MHVFSICHLTVYMYTSYVCELYFGIKLYTFRMFSNGSKEPGNHVFHLKIAPPVFNYEILSAPEIPIVLKEYPLQLQTKECVEFI